MTDGTRDASREQRARDAVDPPAIAAACRRAEDALARAAEKDGAVRDEVALIGALTDLDRARDAGAGAPESVQRLSAYRAEVLRALGRRREAATAYAEALLVDLDNAEAVHDGVLELLDDLGGLEEAERVALAAKALHPGRAWQWDTLVAEARRRAQLELDAPVSATDLPRLRAEVARRLREAPCRHEDDARPVAAAAAAALGFDPARVLPWLSKLGACCCDCQVAAVAGPREPRARR